MNLSTYVAQHPDVSVIAYQHSAQSDIECVPCLKILDVDELNEIVGKSSLDFGKPLISINVDGTKVGIDRMAAMTSLLASRQDGLRFAIIMRRDKTHNFGTAQVIPVTYHNGWYRRVIISTTQTPIVPIRRFAIACMDAIEQGRIQKKNNGKTFSQLNALNLMVTVNGITAALRLDIALALLKRGRKLPIDAYGETVVGALCSVANNKPVWKISYAYPDDNGKVASTELANIDHVFPQSKGGQTRLCNLQMMRTYNNSVKSNTIVPDVDGEPLVSLLVLNKLDAGVKEARKRHEIDGDFFSKWNQLYVAETGECHAVMSHEPTSKTFDEVAGIVSFI